MLNIDKEACIGCKACEKACPFGAIVVVSDTKKAEVSDKCTLCGACVNVCPVDAISIERKKVSKEELKHYQGVFIWGELEKTGDGQTEYGVRSVVYELLGKAQDLAKALNQQITVVIPGPAGLEETVQELFKYGADRVLLCEHELLAQYSTDGYSTVISSVISKEKPAIFLYGATPNGRDLAPRIAGRLELGLTADCTGLEINDEGQLVQTRPAFGGNIMASILSPYTRPQMATARPNVFSKKENDKSEIAKLEKFPVNVSKRTIRTKIIKEEVAKLDTEKIEQAEVLVSAGRGIEKEENLELAEKLANELGGTLAGSRAIVELGWIPHTIQVGQSGKTVSPKLYIALGISGAVQHLVGMSSSDVIIAINKDPEAPIFKVADIGIVGDIFEVVPEFLKLLKAKS